MKMLLDRIDTAKELAKAKSSYVLVISWRLPEDTTPVSEFMEKIPLKGLVEESEAKIYSGGIILCDSAEEAGNLYEKISPNPCGAYVLMIGINGEEIRENTSRSMIDVIRAMADGTDIDPD